MSGTMTWVGLDVHARSTHAAAIDSMTGELIRVRFGAGIDEPVAWLSGLRGPVRACYEAGPTGCELTCALGHEHLFAYPVILQGWVRRVPYCPPA
jgi:hypothetical protein